MTIPNSIFVSQLYDLIGMPECPVIIDARIAEDFDDDPRIIAGALKRDFDRIDALAEEFPQAHLLIYCQKGFKISQGTAALLREKGIRASFLVGGHFAWRDAGLPMVTASKVPRSANESHSLWVTLHRPQMDHLACSWLIKRLVDPKAKILFVEPSQVMNVADRFNATSFGIDNAAFARDDQHSCFAVMLDEFGLIGDSLSILANIVSNRPDPAPETAGLRAALSGLSLIHQDDLDLLDAGMAVYDSYYRWACKL
ncbi:MAG: chromate resistance protein ChrB domain-containing protein [Alphaproteobacteria bacterium]